MKLITRGKQKVQQAAASIKELPRDKILLVYANEVKKRQLKAIKNDNPINDCEFVDELTAQWGKSGIMVYRKAGIELQDLIDIGVKSLHDTSDTFELSKPVKLIMKVAERNAKCPCGSDKKYKKCCGKVK